MFPRASSFKEEASLLPTLHRGPTRQRALTWSFLLLCEEATCARYWMTFLVFSVFPAPDSPLPTELESSLRCGPILTLHPTQQRCLHSALLRVSTREPAQRKGNSKLNVMLWNLASSASRGPPEPGRSRSIPTWQPSDPAVLDIREAAVDLRAKGTVYMCSLERALGGNFCSTHSPVPY